MNSTRGKFKALCYAFKDNIHIYEIKIDGTFPEAQFWVETYPIFYRDDRATQKRGILLFVQEDIPSKLVKHRFLHWD